MLLDERIELTNKGIQITTCPKCKSGYSWDGDDWACPCGGRWYPNIIDPVLARQEAEHDAIYKTAGREIHRKLPEGRPPTRITTCTEDSAWRKSPKHKKYMHEYYLNHKGSK
jgi:hypothetical protein